MAIKIDKTNLVRNLAIKNKLVPFLEQEIGKGEFEWEYKFEGKKGDDAWHPSGDCTPTLLELYHKATSPPEPRQLPSSLLKTFQVGHFWHQYLQEVVLRLGFAGPDDIERRGTKGWGEVAYDGGVKKTKMYYAPFHWATGSGDIAPCAIPGHGEWVVDFKTMGHHDFRRNGLPEWSAAKYECQINIYMDFFDLEQGLIVAICKDSPHDMKELTYTRNQPLIDAIYRKWQLVSECIDQGIEPPADELVDLPIRGSDA